MNNVEFVTRNNTNIELKKNTTVRLLKRILESAGHSICGKRVFIERPTMSAKAAEDSYILGEADKIIFDSKAPTRPLEISVNGENYEVVCNRNDVLIKCK